MAVPVFVFSGPVVSGESAQKKVLYRVTNPMWIVTVGVVNESSIASLGLSVVPDEETTNIRWLDMGHQPSSGVPLIHSDPFLVDAGDIIAAYIWNSSDNDRVRFWVLRQ